MWPSLCSNLQACNEYSTVNEQFVFWTFLNKYIFIYNVCVYIYISRMHAWPTIRVLFVQFPISWTMTDTIFTQKKTMCRFGYHLFAHFLILEWLLIIFYCELSEAPGRNAVKFLLQSCIGLGMNRPHPTRPWRSLPAYNVSLNKFKIGTLNFETMLTPVLKMYY